MSNGERLAGSRKALGLTQDQLARCLGVDRGTVSRWERGVLTIEHPTMLALAMLGIAHIEEDLIKHKS